MDFIDKEIEKYVELHTEREPELLYQLNRQTHLKVINPRMLAGHFQGRLLSMFSHMIKPNNILEVGTYTGYSAICFAEGLQPNGCIYTIDINEELVPMQNEFFKKTHNTQKIKQFVGNALEIIPKIETSFDVVFLDADKSNYTNYYNLIFDKLNKGGYIIADNVLWSGKVLNPNAKDEDTIGLQSFNAMVQNDHRVENILLPIRDGLMICRKI